MAYHSELKWKDHLAPEFDRGGTYYTGHPDYPNSLTWVQLDQDEPNETPCSQHPLCVLAPNADGGNYRLESSVIGVIDTEAITIHRGLALDDGTNECYLRVIIKSPKTGEDEFQKAVENLRTATESMPTTTSPQHPFSLFTDDGAKIQLYHRIFEGASSYQTSFFLPKLSELVGDTGALDHEFLPIQQDEYQVLRDTGYSIVQDPEQYESDMHQQATMQPLIVDGGDSNALDLVHLDDAVLAISFIITGTGSHDICGEIKEVVKIVDRE